MTRRLQRPAAARAEGHHVRGRAALHPGPAARRASSPRPAAASCSMPLPVGLVYDPAGKVVARPRHRRAARAAAPVRHRSPRTGSARATVQGVQRRRAAVPGARYRTGAAQGRAGLEAAAALRGCCGSCTTPATPARSSTAGAANSLDRHGKKSYQLVPREQWIALHPRRPPRLHQPGPVRGQPASCCRPTPPRTAATAPPGPAREGPALLQGLVICGRCGQRMTVRYHPRRGVEVPDYLA